MSDSFGVSCTLGRGDVGRDALGTIGLEHPLSAAAVEPGVAFRDFAQALYQKFGLDLAGNNPVYAAAQQFKGKFLIGFLGDDHQAETRGLPHQVRNCVHGIRRQGGFKDQDVGGKFLGSGKGLGKGFGLSHHPDVVFQGKDLAQPGTEDGLRVSHDHANELAVNFLRLLNVHLHAGGSA